MGIRLQSGDGFESASIFLMLARFWSASGVDGMHLDAPSSRSKRTENWSMFSEKEKNESTRSLSWSLRNTFKNHGVGSFLDKNWSLRNKGRRGDIEFHDINSKMKKNWMEGYHAVTIRGVSVVCWRWWVCFLDWERFWVLISTALRWWSTASRFVDKTNRNAADTRGEEAFRLAKRSNPSRYSDSNTKNEEIRTKCISKRIFCTLSRIANCRIGSWSASWLALASKRMNLTNEKYENAKKKAAGTDMAQNEHLWIGIL